MPSQLLKPFQKAYGNLDLLPLLTEKDLKTLGVEYGTQIVEELEQLIEDSPTRDCKILLAGHRGCGKSTLLSEVKRRLDNRFFIVLFSISDMIEMSDINHVNILFAIAVRLMEEAETQSIPIKKSIKEQFYRWFAKHTKTEIEQFEAEVSGGFNFSTLFVWIKGILKTNALIRQEIKQEFERNISELVQTINTIASIVQTESDREIVVIIDDIDKWLF